MIQIKIINVKKTVVYLSATYNGEMTHRKQAVGGRPPRYVPAQACNGSAQRQPRARPAEPGPISQYAPSSRPAAHAAHRPDVHYRRQTASSRDAPWAGPNNER